jgi:hypothetical protein
MYDSISSIVRHNNNRREEMENGTSGGVQLITMLVTFFLFGIPIAFLNASIARRKGRSAAAFGWLSMIPFVGIYLAIYLVSITDKELRDNVDKILEFFEKKQQ